METSIRIELHKNGGSDQITIYGNIDSSAAPHFEQAICGISSERVVIDFSNVGRIDSMGMTLLLRSINLIKLQKKAEVRIQGANEINSILFRMVGITLLASQE